MRKLITTDNRDIIIDASLGDESFLAVIGWNTMYAHNIEHYLQWVNELRGSQKEQCGELEELVFNGGGELFERSKSSCDWFEKHDPGETFDNKGWIIVDVDPAFDEESKFPISSVKLNVSRHGHFHWLFLPKYGEAREIETRALYYSEVQERLFTFEEE